jgi:hypothetical protein
MGETHTGMAQGVQTSANDGIHCEGISFMLVSPFDGRDAKWP